MDLKYLQNIDSPADLKRLTIDELPEVCAELREYIIDNLSKHPGHLASSLGAIELTVALHYVFSAPDDRLIWDVGHQAYAHKILTGRRDLFPTNRQYKGLAPFPTPLESQYDAFVAGHASNSISAALGEQIALQQQGSKQQVVAIIGDGAMTGGLAFEGLNNTSMNKNNLLIILNDNNMAIDPIQGGFTEYLLNLTTSAHYNRWRWRMFKLAKRLHLISDESKGKVQRFHNSLKAMLTKQPKNIFTGLNIRYFGPADGHNVKEMVRILSEIKNYEGPRVLHIVTKKGKGYAPAEADQTLWHAPGEFNVSSGVRKADSNSCSNELWQHVFGTELLQMAKQDERIVGVTPAMLGGCSMNLMQQELPDRVFDVGIAEGHAVTFSAGLAKEGMIPFCNIYSSFLQRAYDNIIHDVALCSLHVVFCIDRAGIVGADGATHHGLFDLAYLRPIPNLQIAAPRTGADLRAMMRYAAQAQGPVAIRYPRGPVAEDTNTHDEASTDLHSAVCLKQGTDLAVLSIGAIGNIVSQALNIIEKNGQTPSIAHYDMRWLKPIDTQVIDEIIENGCRTIFTAEDGVIAGGLGSAVIEYIADKGYQCRVVRIGINDQFVEHGSTAELYQSLGLDALGIAQTIQNNL